MLKTTFKINSLSTVNALEQENKYQDPHLNSIDLNKYLGLRIGDYKFSTQTNDFNNWLKCDGRLLSKTEYPELYDVIGDIFSNSTPSAYFNIPDFRSRVVGMPGPGQIGPPFLSNYALGTATGYETHTLTIPEMPTHLHTGTTDIAGDHTHGVTDPGHTHAYFNQPNTVSPAVSLTTTDVADNVNVNQTTSSSTTNITINNAGSHVHTFTTQTTGNGQPHNNMQPTLFGSNVFIYSRVDKYILLVSDPNIEFNVLTDVYPYLGKYTDPL